MRGIANFFTLFWCIYFPTCIAFNDLPGFTYIDELMMVILIAYTFIKYNSNIQSINRKPWSEYAFFLVILVFYIAYSLAFGRNVPDAVWNDLVQVIRPYTIIYCTWILNPQFSKKQKKKMLSAVVLTLFSWIVFNPGKITRDNAEFPILGQLAICAGMSWFLFTEPNKRNQWIALGLVATGLLAPKFKFMGEVVCFVYLVFFLRKRLNFHSYKTIAIIAFLMISVLFVTWERFDLYYVTGWSGTGNGGRMARPETYKTALQILWDYFPFGPGMGTFACIAAWRYYSPLYYEYNLNTIWGLTPGGGFIADAFYPSLAQFGIIGVVLFILFWKRRLADFNKISDLRYYKIAFMAFFCIALEQVADSSWLSGKGMGYCMLIGLCLNMVPKKKSKKKSTMTN